MLTWFNSGRAELDLSHWGVFLESEFMTIELPDGDKFLFELRVIIFLLLIETITFESESKC